MRKGLFLLAFLFVTLFALSGMAAEKATEPLSFKAELSGKEVTPPADTAAAGEVTIEVPKGGEALSYTINVRNIANPTGAHIHLGREGQSGPPVAGFHLDSKKQGEFSGTLAEGTIRESDLMGPLKGKPLSALIELLESGDAYVNIHTNRYPNGEVRGQIG